MVELDGSGSAFGKQFKRADRSRARWALVLGDEEAERGEVRLKPLQQQGEEITVALSGIAAIVEILRLLEHADSPCHWGCRFPWLPFDRPADGGRGGGDLPRQLLHRA